MRFRFPHRSLMEDRGAPPRALLLACLVVVVANALLLGGAAARRGARIALDTTVETLRGNLTTLVELRSDRQAQLETALADARRRLAAAQAALPPDLARPDIFRLGYELAEDSAVLVLSLHRAEGEVRNTLLGPVAISNVGVVAQAGLEACLAFLGSFEDLGAGVGLADVVIRPDQAECSFDVLTLSRGP